MVHYKRKYMILHGNWTNPRIDQYFMLDTKLNKSQSVKLTATLVLEDQRICKHDKLVNGFDSQKA